MQYLCKRHLLQNKTIITFTSVFNHANNPKIYRDLIHSQVSDVLYLAEKEAAQFVPLLLRTNCELHGNQAETQNKENCNDGNSNVSLCVLASQQSDQGICNAANADTIRDRVGQRHHDQCQKGRNSGTNIIHVNLSKTL